MVRKTFCLWMTATALTLAGCAHAPRGEVALEEWNSRHPEAASELCAWVRNHPEASHQFFEWDSSHHQRAQEFITWTLEHPGRGIDAFVRNHPGWEGFDWMSETHHPAANTFMAWIRRHPVAARDLMDRPSGLHWAGNHLAC